MAHIKRGAPYSGADLGGEGIGDAEGDRQQRCRDVAQAQAAQSPEHHEGQDADIHPRDDEDVIGAGALKVDASVAVDESVFANDHRINQGGLARRPELMHFRDDPAVQAAAPGRDAAAGKAGEPFDIFHFGRAQCRDVVIRKIAAIVESAGIAKISRRPELGGETDTVAVMKERNVGRNRVGVFFRTVRVRL